MVKVQLQEAYNLKLRINHSLEAPLHNHPLQSLRLNHSLEAPLHNQPLQSLRLNHSLEAPLHKDLQASAVLGRLSLVQARSLNSACLNPLLILAEACSQHLLEPIVAAVCSVAVLLKTLGLRSLAILGSLIFRRLSVVSTSLIQNSCKPDPKSELNLC